MTQLWTITRMDDGAVLAACIPTPGLDSHPADNGWAWEAATQVASPITARPDVATGYWNGSAWVDDLERLRALRWGQVKVAREQRLLTAPTPFGVFDTDEISKGRITGQIASLRELGDLDLALPDTIVWRLHDNSFATMTVTEFRQAALLCAQHERDVLAASWSLEAAIAAASDRAEIEAVDVDAGWPDA